MDSIPKKVSFFLELKRKMLTFAYDTLLSHVA